MGLSDHGYVNFSEDYELNYHLSKLGKSQNEQNRNTLKEQGEKLKKTSGLQYLSHATFHAYMKNRLSLLS